jgi:hypothetical protein
VTGPARRFQVAYSSVVEEYLCEPTEATLHHAYELGRSAVEMGLSILELASIHHEVLRTAVERSRDAAASASLVDVAGEVFMETLSAFEMVTRGFAEAQELALVERRQAAVVRRLSEFLADAALAMDEEEAVQEALQLVTEHARELVDASRCEICVARPGDPRRNEAIVSTGSQVGARAGGVAREEVLQTDLTGLDGHRLGTLVVARKGRSFTTLERALVDQLAQITSAALERSRLYHHRGRG